MSFYLLFSMMFSTYIEYKKDITGNYRIKITHEGLHYSEFEKLSMKSPATSVTINGDVTDQPLGI